jgi:Mrp family chromosome partitioning ATPase
MPSKEQIQQALTQVIDPELNKNIVEAGMVRDIQVEDGDVTVILALTMAGCPLKEQLHDQTQAAAAAVEGVEHVKVEMTTMTAEERHRLTDRMPKAVNLNKVAHIVAVMSGKGGVGKSSLTALLATALRRKGLMVGVLDADLTGPSIPRLFGVTGPVRAIPMGMIPVESESGVRVMSTNLMLPEEDSAVLWRGPIMSGTIKQFWGEVLWGRLDYLLIDLPPGTSDATLTVMQALPMDGVLMVTTPQQLASMVVRKTVRMCQELNVEILGIVENMSYFSAPDTGTKYMIFGPSNSEAIAKLAGVPIIGQLPINPELAQLADSGAIEDYENPAYDELAEAFLARVSVITEVPAATE